MPLLIHCFRGDLGYNSRQPIWSMSSDLDNIKIKDYQIHLPPLGEGTFGTVYRATYRSISDRALKVYRSGAVDIVTMARELEKLSKVAEHNGIVTLHDFDLLQEPAYYAMGLHADEKPDGTWETRTLERMCGHVDYQEAWRLIREIADAVSYLHRHQIVHCDIKPTNILLTDETPHHIKICDFGQSRGMTAAGFEPVGTPLYASPEQLRAPSDSGDGKGFRWDVYSFGVVAYKLLTGDLPRLQTLANAEKKHGDLEATIKEASIEETMAEGNMLDGEHLANLVESVEEIQWPDNFYIPTARKLLIEQCLSIDPAKRPSDMREVWSRIKERDHYRAVRRARRVAALFALLSVFAIWATVVAFVQAGRAKEASKEAMVSGDQAEQLALIIVDELNKGKIRGQGAENLHSIIADHSETFLANLPKNRRSNMTLKLSAQTASMRGNQAFKNGDLEEALDKYSNAFEIRKELGGQNLSNLAFRDLFQIGLIHSELGRKEQAIESYQAVKDWRKQGISATAQPTKLQVDELSEVYSSLADVYHKSKRFAEASELYGELLGLLDSNLAKATPSQVINYNRQSMITWERLGDVQIADGKLKDAYDTFAKLSDLSAKVVADSPNDREATRRHELNANHKVGQILMQQKNKTAALNCFLKEIGLWKNLIDLRPYEAQYKIGLADAYQSAAKCLDIEDDQSRSKAEFFLDQALAQIGGLPSDMRNSEDNELRALRYRSQLDALLEKEESGG